MPHICYDLQNNISRLINQFNLKFFTIRYYSFITINHMRYESLFHRTTANTMHMHSDGFRALYTKFAYDDTIAIIKTN